MFIVVGNLLSLHFARTAGELEMMYRVAYWCGQASSTGT